MKMIFWITTGVLALASLAPADDTSQLDRGHRLLIKHGLQIQAQVFHSPLARLDLEVWRRSNFTTVNLHSGHHAAAPGYPDDPSYIHKMLGPARGVFIPGRPGQAGKTGRHGTLP